MSSWVFTVLLAVVGAAVVLGFAYFLEWRYRVVSLRERRGSVSEE